MLRSTDVLNRRVRESVTTYSQADGGEGNDGVHSLTTAQEFVYDGDHVIFDFTGGGNTYVPTTRYMDGNAVDQVFAQETTAKAIDDAARVYWFLSDNQNTTRDLLAADGQSVVTHFTYDSFGKVLSGNTSLTRYLFTGRELDTATGLQYNRNRWYYSQLGRWTSEDPIEADPNAFRYADNSPTNVVDPTGLIDWTEAGARSALIDLHTLWTQAGYELAPTLLFWFLAGNTSDHDMSSYSGLLTSSAKYRTKIYEYVKSLAETHEPGEYHLPDSENPFEIEYLGLTDINWLHPYNSAGDLAYAVGTAHFRYKNAALVVSKECEDGQTHVTATFTARMTMYDKFAFWTQFPRNFFYYYQAGNYLQEDRGYAPVPWHMSWSQSTTIDFTVSPYIE